VCPTCSIPGCPIGRPIPWREDMDWWDKIQLARQAFEVGKNMRAGKPKSFHRGLR
jgi:hypothetical protein